MNLVNNTSDYGQNGKDAAVDLTVTITVKHEGVRRRISLLREKEVVVGLCTLAISVLGFASKPQCVPKIAGKFFYGVLLSLL
jgi:hypothetical protein